MERWSRELVLCPDWLLWALVLLWEQFYQYNTAKTSTKTCDRNKKQFGWCFAEILLNLSAGAGVSAEGEESLLLIGLSRDLMDCWGRQHKPQGGRLATLGTPGTLARLGTRPGYTTHHGAHGWGLVLTMYWGQHGELIKFREKGTLIDNKSFLSELFAINYRLETDDKTGNFPPV